MRGTAVFTSRLFSMAADTGTQTKQAEVVLQAQDYLKMLRNHWIESLIVFILVFVTCVLMTVMMTPTYQSAISFEIYYPNEVVSVPGGGDSRTPGTNTGNYMQTQHAVLLSDVHLESVAKELGEQSDSGASSLSAGAIRSMLRLKPQVGTNIVNVTATSTEPALARDVCNALVNVYIANREAEELGYIRDAREARSAVLAERRKILDRKAEVVRQIIRSGRYTQNIWAESGASSPVSTDAEEQTQSSLRQISESLKSEISQMEVHINHLLKLKDEALLSYVTRTGLLTAESYCSARVRELNEAFRREVEDRQQKLISGYGEKHPVILRIDEQHRSTREQLFEELLGMREAMSDQLDVKKAEFDKLAVRLEEARNKLRDKALEDQRVMHALQDYRQEKARFDRLENDAITDEMRMMSPRRCVKVFSRPVVAQVPSSPNYRLNLTAGAGVGLICAIVVAVLISYFDTSIKTLEDAERQLGLPVLGVIPQNAALLLLQEGADSPDVEAYRILRTNIELKKSLHRVNSIAVVSSNAGEGKTTTVSNLAYVFASAGYNVLMVDADLRRPRLAAYAELESELGLTNYLVGTHELKDVVFRTSAPNLYLLPSGPQTSDPSGLLSSHRMDQLLAEAAERFDIVLFDAPPVLGVSDASLLVSKVNATLIVLQPSKMPLKALLRTKMQIENAGGKLLGLVMNNVDISADTQYQYYTTYYSYYSHDTKRPEPTSTAENMAKETAKALAKSRKAEQKSAEVYDDEY